MEYRRTGVMPNEGLRTDRRPQKSDVEDTWSANVDEMASNHGGFSSDPFGDHQQRSNASFVSTEPNYGQISQYDAGDISTEYQNYSQTSLDLSGRSPHPGRATSFGSVENLSVAMPAYDETLAPSALSPTQTHSAGGRIGFPEGRYDSKYR